MRDATRRVQDMRTGARYTVRVRESANGEPERPPLWTAQDSALALLIITLMMLTLASCAPPSRPVPQQPTQDDSVRVEPVPMPLIVLVA